VTLSLWPLPWEIEAPLFLFTLGTIVFGFLFGAAVTWISGGTTRQKLRAAHRELAHAQDELVALKRQQVSPARPNPANAPTALPPAA
jgi:putative membrane protein